MSFASHPVRDSSRPAHLVGLLLAALLLPTSARAADGAHYTGFDGDGRRRLNFDLGGNDDDQASDIAVDSLDRVVTVGIIKNADGLDRWAVSRVLRDGTPDVSFGPGGYRELTQVGDPSHPPAVAIVKGVGGANENTILIVGGSGSPVRPAFCRVTANGATRTCGVDNTRLGWFADVVLRGTWGIMVGSTPGGFGATDRDVLVQVRSAATLFVDATWGSSGTYTIAYDFGDADDQGRAVGITADGEIIVAGNCSTSAGDKDWFWTKINPGGTARLFDEFLPFDLGGGFDDEVTGLALAPDESFVIVGAVEAQAGGGARVGAVVWVKPSGELRDAIWDAEVASYDDVVLQGDGKAVAVGEVDGTSVVVSRFRTDRFTDPAFGGGDGFVTDQFEDGPGQHRAFGVGVALQNGRIAVGATTEWLAPDYDFGIIMLANSHTFADGFESGTRGFWSTTSP